MQQYYRDSYWQDRGLHHKNVGEAESGPKQRAAGVIAMLEGIIRAADFVIEIGCGSAEILSEVRKRFACDVQGVEPSLEQAEAARRRHGIEIQCSDLDSMDLNGRRANLVILSHVLEHIYDPLAALVRIRSMLATDGWLLVEVPNMLRPNRSKRLSNWLAREHVYYFSRNSLRRALAHSGFRTIVIREREYLRILAKSSADCGLESPKNGRDIMRNDYWRVRFAIIKHEATYWPWYVLKKVVAGLSRRILGSSVQSTNGNGRA
jgi:SAM-dependent methyltransferase